MAGLFQVWWQVFQQKTLRPSPEDVWSYSGRRKVVQGKGLGLTW